MKRCWTCRRELEEIAFRLLSEGHADKCLLCESDQVNPARAREWNKRKKYGLTDGQYNKLKKIQVCEICGSDNGGKNLCYDHSHKTHAVRGRLCTRCNLGLGNFKDNPKLLHKAARYLEARYYEAGQDYKQIR